MNKLWWIDGSSGAVDIGPFDTQRDARIAWAALKGYADWITWELRAEDML